MQGTVITSLKCSVQIDTLAKECLNSGSGMFKYKGCLPIPLVDDVLAVGWCGSDSLKLNSIIQSKMATKKLELGKNKCFQIHVGNNCPKFCPNLNVHEEIMKTTSSEKYLGDIISNSGKIDENIENRVNKGMGSVNSIISLVEEISFGENYFEMALLFRNSMLNVLYGVKKTHLDILECNINIM